MFILQFQLNLPSNKKQFIINFKYIRYYFNVKKNYFIIFKFNFMSIKKIGFSLVIAMTAFGNVNTFAQDKSPRKSEVFRTVEKMPTSTYDLNKFLSTNLKYPKVAVEKKIQGTVYVEFVVSEEGIVKNCKVVKGEKLGAGLPEEALRVVKSMPKWNPGMQSGKPVSVYYTVPIKFAMK